MSRLLLFGLLLAPTLLSAQTKPWPREFRGRPAKVALSSHPENGNQLATTRHFRIESETTINRPDLERFATVVESVPHLLERFPLPLWSPPPGKQADILICQDEASFRKAGGQPSTIGWYDARRRHVLLRADYFLTPPPRRPTRLAPRPNQDILVHELVHMGMSGLLVHLPPWLSEGIAEYFAVCHKGNGYYTFHDVGTSLRDRIRETIGADREGKVALLPVAEILGLDPDGWMKATHSFANGNPFLPYATALLLAHYHLNGGQSRRQKTATYLEDLHRLRFRDAPPAFETDQPADIEARLTRYWRPRGLNLKFGLE